MVRRYGYTTPLIGLHTPLIWTLSSTSGDILKQKVLELLPGFKDLGGGEEAKEALERALIIA